MEEEALKKIVSLFTLVTLLIASCQITIFADSNNLLINGNGENGLDGWIDSDGAWGTSAEVVPHEGSLFIWPQRLDIENTTIYQDVLLTDYAAGTWVQLSGWLCNYDQYPHDQATLRLEFLDVSGNIIENYQQEQRNPSWEEHVISAKIPQGAVSARVKLVADRFVGSDNDAYFDDLSFIVMDKQFQEVSITGNKDKAAAGDQVQLNAGGNASDYDWSSSYDKIATVDETGLVTFVNDGKVSIYAEDKNTGVVGVYRFNEDDADLPYLEIVLQIDNPYMVVNDVQQEIDPGRGTVPILVSGRTMLPVRAIVEAMGGTVGWEDTTRTVSVTYRGTTVEMIIDDKMMTKNGEQLEMDVAPTVINSRTMVPVRFIVDNLPGCSIEWDNASRSATIYY